jgi:pimeloyl-ACP methyl ester carboxylesterase
MSLITTQDGLHLWYEEVGQGEPLLLVSGQGADHSYWDGIRDDFADHCRVIVYDNRGTGQSDKPSAPPYSTRGFARDAVALLDQLGISRAHVYGHSMGGRIGQWLGIDYGERLGALVLGASTPGNAHGVARAAEVNALLAHAPADPHEALKAFGSLIVTPAWLETHPESIMQMSQAARIPLYARRLHYRASEGHDSWKLLPRIGAPTLIIHGADDELNPVANASLLATRIPGAELHIIEDGRHGYMFDFREESSRVVNSFLSRHRFS